MRGEPASIHRAALRKGERRMTAIHEKGASAQFEMLDLETLSDLFQERESDMEQQIKLDYLSDELKNKLLVLVMELYDLGPEQTWKDEVDPFGEGQLRVYHWRIVDQIRELIKQAKENGRNRLPGIDSTEGAVASQE